MKYVKLYGCAVLLGLSGCAMQSDMDGWNYDGSQPVPLAETRQYLPVQERGKEGEILPYEAEPNPYTQQKGQIDKAVVTSYIDARRAFKARKLDFAEELLIQLTEDQPDLSGPWVMRGDVALKREKLDQAIEHYVTALKVNPVNFNAYLRLAKAQRMQGHFHHAQNTYARALERWPDGPELHLNLGVLYDVYLNQPVKAQAHMEAFQLLRGDNREVADWLEEIRSRTGISKALKVEESEKDEQVADKPPTSPSTQSGEAGSDTKAAELAAKEGS